MIPQLEPQGMDPQPEILEIPEHSEQQAQGQSLNEDPEVEAESPNLLDKLLEDHKERGEEEDKDSYRSSLFIPNVWRAFFKIWNEYFYLYISFFPLRGKYLLAFLCNLITTDSVYYEAFEV